MAKKQFPCMVNMDGRTYEIKAIHTVKTGERLAKAVLHHPIVGKQEVHSPSIRLRLAHQYDQIRKDCNS